MDEMPRRSEDAVHTEKSEDGDRPDGQKRQETEKELFFTGLGDEVEVDTANRSTTVRNWLVGPHVKPSFQDL